MTSIPLHDDDGNLLGVTPVSVQLTDGQRSAMWYQAVVEHASDLIVVVDREARVVYAGPGIEALLGHRPSEVVGRKWWDFIDGQDHEAVAEDLLQATDPHRPPPRVLFRAIGADGSRRYVEAVANRLEDEHGVRVAVVGRDVHQRELATLAADDAKRRAAASEFRLRAVLEASPLSVVAFNLDGTCTAVAGRLFGPDMPAPQVGDSIEALGQRLGFSTESYRQRLLAGGRATTEITCGDRVVQLHHAPVYGDGDAVIGGVVVATEVTGERQAQEQLEQREARFRALVQRSTDAAVIGDETGTIVWCSPAVTELFGYQPEDVLGRPGHHFIHPEDRGRVASHYEQLVAGVPQPPFEMRLVKADGSWTWVEERITNLLDEPAVRGVVANLRDISARRAASEAVAASEQRYRTVVESAGDGICIYDRDGRVTLANPRLREMLQIEVTPERMIEWVHPEDRHLGVEGLARRRRGESDSFEMRFVRTDGDTVHALITANPLFDGEGRFEGGVLMITDITERKRAEEELARLALTDLLTGLPNRALILDRVAQALARAERHHQRVAVMFLDVDQFKLVNDSFGHLVGDELLRDIAQRITGSVRSGDTTIGRLGGDEFVVLCEGLTDDAPALAVASRIHDALASPFSIGNHELYVTASIGVAFGPPGDPGTLLSHADAAMYRAKQAGRARTELFDDELRQAARDRLQLLSDLRVAIDARQLLLEYQPVRDVASSHVVGVEALVRWRHPQRGIIPPAAFIAAAEDSGLIVEIGAQILEMALRQGAEWAGQGLDLLLSVNLSPRQITEPTLVDRVSAALADSGFDPGRLCLEITESAVMEDVAAAVAAMDQLRGLGVRLAIDDFGTGYSSLTYLSTLPVDILKIDRAFIAPLPQDGAPIVEAITRLARAVGVHSVAEGVETPEQAEAVQRLGCTYAQGYLWSRPVPAEQLPHVVAALGTAGAPTQPPRR